MKRLLSIFLIFVFALFASCSVKLDDRAGSLNNTQQDSAGNMSGALVVSVIDVGQGDSILVRTPHNRYILIDAGSKNEKDKLFKYLKKQGIGRFDAVIATHPHEDHIGNLDDIIRQYDIGNVYMPKVTANTAAFQNLMDAVKIKGIKIKKASSGVSFTIDNVDFKFVAPNGSKYDDLNNYSAVLKVKYGNKSFLLMGDAEKLSENEILASGQDIKADVIKIGHHGSSSSSSKTFIEAVDPQYAVISCGKQNDYGHPHRETLMLLNDMNIKIYRTDNDGTTSFYTDGKSFKISTNK